MKDGNIEKVSVDIVFVDQEYCCLQYKGYDIYEMNDEKGWYYIWDSKTKEETFNFESVYVAIQHIDSKA